MSDQSVWWGCIGQVHAHTAVTCEQHCLLPMQHPIPVVLSPPDMQYHALNRQGQRSGRSLPPPRRAPKRLVICGHG